MRFSRTVVAGVIGTAVIMAAVGTASIPTASAATSACGTGFNQVGSVVLKSSAGKAGPGVLEVFWNRSTQQNCALSVHTGASVGVAASTAVKLRASTSSGWKIDKGNYKSYAGPVTEKSPGCVDVYGNIVVNKVLYSATQLKSYCNADPNPVAAPPSGGSSSGGSSRGASAPVASKPTSPKSTSGSTGGGAAANRAYEAKQAAAQAAASAQAAAQAAADRQSAARAAAAAQARKNQQEMNKQPAKPVLCAHPIAPGVCGI